METVTVNAKALRRLLSALIGPPHYIHELQATRDNGMGLFDDNPIDILCKEYIAAVDAFNEQHKKEREENEKSQNPFHRR